MEYSIKNCLISMLFFLYLKEIRFRLFYCFISLLYSWFICFTFIEEVIYYFAKPLLVANYKSSDLFTHFIFTNLGDAFFSFFNLSLAIGCFISFYFFIFQLFCYIVPSLYFYEKNIFVLIVLSSIFALAFSSVFWYGIFMPTICYFFLGFELTNTFLSFEILFEGKIDEYFTLVLGSLYSLAIIFQFPILLLFLVVFGLLDIRFLVAYRKIIYFGFLVVSAFLTPPDVFSQFLFICPFLVFYEFVIFLTFYFNEYKQD